MGGAFFEVLDPGFVVGAELVQQSAEFGLSAFQTAGRLDLSPGVPEGSVVCQAEVTLSIAKQVDGAKLVIGVGEQTLEQGGQAGEVVGDQQENAQEAAVSEID